MTDRPGPVVGVGALIISDGRLLMIERGRGANRGLWSVPGGRVEYGERLAEALVREVREETSLEVEVGEMVWAGETMGPGDPPAWHYVLVDFLATVRGGELRPGDDAAAAEWVLLEEVGNRPVTPTLLELLQTLR